MAHIPLVKLGALLIKTLTKPLTNSLKKQSQNSPLLQSYYESIGQAQHRMSIKIHMGFRDLKHYTIKDLPREQAINQGADLAAEFFMFTVAAALATGEYARSSKKNAREKEKQRLQSEEKDLALQKQLNEMDEKLLFLEESNRVLHNRLVEKGIIKEN